MSLGEGRPDPVSIGALPGEYLTAEELRDIVDEREEEASSREAVSTDRVDRSHLRSTITATGRLHEQNMEVDKGIRVMEAKLRDLINKETFGEVYKQDREKRMQESYGGPGTIANMNRWLSGVGRKDTDIPTEEDNWKKEAVRRLAKIGIKSVASGSIGLAAGLIIGGVALPALGGIVLAGTAGAVVGRGVVEGIRVYRGKERKQRAEIEKSHYHFLKDLGVYASSLILDGEQKIRDNEDDAEFNLYADTEYVNKITEIYTLLFDHSKRYVKSIMVPAEALEEEPPGIVASDIDAISQEAGVTRTSGEKVEQFHMVSADEAGAVKIDDREIDLRKEEKKWEKISDWVSAATSIASGLAYKFTWGAKAVAEAATKHADKAKQALDAHETLKNINLKDFPGQRFAHDIFKGTDGVVHYIREVAKELRHSTEDLGATAGKLIGKVGMSVDEVIKRIYDQDIANWTAQQLGMIAAWGVTQLAVNVGSWYANERLTKASQTEGERITGGELEWVKSIFDNVEKRARALETEAVEEDDIIIRPEVINLRNENNFFVPGSVVTIEDPESEIWLEVGDEFHDLLADGQITFEVVSADSGADGEVILVTLDDNAPVSVNLDTEFLLDHPELYKVDRPRRQVNGRDESEEEQRVREKASLTSDLEIIIKEAQGKKVTKEQFRQMKDWLLSYIEKNPREYDGEVDRRDIYSNPPLLQVETEKHGLEILFHLSGDIIGGEEQVKVVIGEDEDGVDDDFADDNIQIVLGDAKSGDKTYQEKVAKLPKLSDDQTQELRNLAKLDVSVSAGELLKTSNGHNYYEVTLLGTKKLKNVPVILCVGEGNLAFGSTNVIHVSVVSSDDHGLIIGSLMNDQAKAETEPQTDDELLAKMENKEVEAFFTDDVLASVFTPSDGIYAMNINGLSKSYGVKFTNEYLGVWDNNAPVKIRIIQSKPILTAEFINEPDAPPIPPPSSEGTKGVDDKVNKELRPELTKDISEITTKLNSMTKPTRWRELNNKDFVDKWRSVTRKLFAELSDNQGAIPFREFIFDGFKLLVETRAPRYLVRLRSTEKVQTLEAEVTNTVDYTLPSNAKITYEYHNPVDTAWTGDDYTTRVLAEANQDPVTPKEKNKGKKESGKANPEDQIDIVEEPSADTGPAIPEEFVQPGLKLGDGLKQLLDNDIFPVLEGLDDPRNADSLKNPDFVSKCREVAYKYYQDNRDQPVDPKDSMNSLALEGRRLTISKSYDRASIFLFSKKGWVTCYGTSLELDNPLSLNVYYNSLNSTSKLDLAKAGEVYRATEMTGALSDKKEKPPEKPVSAIEESQHTEAKVGSVYALVKKPTGKYFKGGYSKELSELGADLTFKCLRPAGASGRDSVLLENSNGAKMSMLNSVFEDNFIEKKTEEGSPDDREI